ncbi:queuosine precursor transporter [Hujiaoplasma nucleasis]|uniref:Probable queuosine precursor transporter n=1 Tax=Hujiaoplasma nucleasis TaxID=2725268 RepID=A0A7L6N059_9MOLU|nr:queuosine precursor transporter [Hujiaoplasma nucleasis]QLY39623.1 queuosine precursor transporter [Hujiaoplasma nucleasis]
MPNEIIWIFFALTNFGFFLLSYKFFGRLGIFLWIVLSTILANIQVLTVVDLFGVEASLGNILYGTIFLATDVLNEIYSKREAKKAVFIGFSVMFVTVIIMQIAIQFKANENDWAMPYLKEIFGFLPIVFIASMLAFIVSQLVDVYIFSKIKDKLPDNKYLWIRNNGSTILSQFLDTVIFVPIAFYYKDFNSILILIFTTYFIKLIVAILDTPVIYLAKKIKPIEN